MKTKVETELQFVCRGDRARVAALLWTRSDRDPSVLSALGRQSKVAVSSELLDQLQAVADTDPSAVRRLAALDVIIGTAEPSATINASDTLIGDYYAIPSVSHAPQTPSLKLRAQAAEILSRLSRTGKFDDVRKVSAIFLRYQESSKRSRMQSVK